MVNTSLYTGLSGLRVHQNYIDVIGANLANVSTPGYRGSRVTFSDVLSVTVRTGSGPNADFGGTNPVQLGLGATIGSVDIDTAQGTFQDTGRSLDVAIQGRGFFELSNGTQSFYTRVGSFGVDSERNLVDLRTGYRVVGSAGSDIRIPVSDTLPAQATTSVRFGGNLPATVTGPLAEVVQSESTLQAGVAATAQAAPPGGGGSTYDLSPFMPSGSLLVAVDGNASQRITFTPADFVDPANATAAEIAAKFASLSQSLQATGNASGTIDFATTRLGDAATLKFDDEASSTGLLAALGLNSTLTSGSQSAATAATDLAGLTTRSQAYTNGDQIRVEGTSTTGAPFSATFVYGTDGTTVGDFVTFVNGLLPAGDSALAIDTDGSLSLTAAAKGDAQLSLHVSDLSTPIRNAWPSFRVTQDGTGPDTATTSIDVVDSLGRAHAVQMTFTRSTTDDTVWSLQASMDASEGQIVNGTIGTIRFNSDGSFNVIGGGSNNLTFRFADTPDQDVTVDLGTSGAFDGVSMLGDSTSVAAVDQDGFGAGELLNVAFDGLGNLSGFYSNGQSQTIDTLRLVMFPNEEGLLRAGDTLFTAGPNSDDPITTTANASGAGTVRPGSLENSNVDIAEEFVSLIEAQRGFQANSRVITTTDEILAELVNIVR